MLLSLILLALVVHLTVVEGKGCWADTKNLGIPCIYGFEYQYDVEQGIQYSFTSLFSNICCKAFTCEENPYRCQFQDIGCGQSFDSVTITPAALPWELNGIEPIIRCYDRGSNLGAYYSYTVNAGPLETWVYSVYVLFHERTGQLEMN